MSLITIFLISVGLSMDAFAVAITAGLNMKRFEVKKALIIGCYFGVFQAIMPLIGWFLGIGFKQIISFYDHWIAFGILSVIGIKMIIESQSIEEKSEFSFSIKRLLVLAIATSIDAAAVGLSFSFLQVTILKPAIIIGVITFFISCFGVYIGKKIGHFCEKKIEIFGGLILIGIGIKILIEHLFF